MICQAFVWVLDQEPDLEVVAQARSLAEVRARVTARGVDGALVDPSSWGTLP
jgi:hypothetical protein